MQHLERVVEIFILCQVNRFINYTYQNKCARLKHIRIVSITSDLQLEFNKFRKIISIIFYTFFSISIYCNKVMLPIQWFIPSVMCLISYTSGKNCCWATDDNSISIGFVSSYNAGASQSIANVPTIEAIVKIHRNNRSKTMATNPQSWSSYNRFMAFSQIQYIQ